MDFKEAANLFAAMIPALQMWWRPIQLLAILAGLILVIKGLAKVAPNKRMQDGDAVVITSSLIAGLLLINVIPMLDVFSMTFFTQESAKGLSYVPPHAEQPTGVFVQFAIYIVMLVGFVSSIKGLLMLSASGQNGSLFGPAVTRIIGGSLSVNIVTVIQVLGGTVGGTIESSLSGIIG